VSADGPVRIDPSSEGEAAPADEALRLPAGDPRRSAFLVETLRRVIDATNRGDWEAAAGIYDPEMEIHITRYETGELWGGDFDPVYRGIEGLRRANELWNEPWAELVLVADEIVDEGGDLFVLFGRWVGRGRGSGIEIDQPWAARVTLRGGRVLRMAWFPSLEAAREELGL
jgi:hypothetical protein